MDQIGDNLLSTDAGAEPAAGALVIPGVRLRRVDLQGFKTFANRTTLELRAPVTAVVGPNGSGKSNLADAIRWVLGEQSLKAVRGKKTEDVIFAGGPNRAPSGLAEVSLTLDNADALLPLPYSEVTVTRRAYRSGENDYLLNRARLRLRDLSDLLLRARLTQNGYTVIGQGMVDAILNHRPEERRELLEEAADVKRYHTRIAESRARLEETEQNLLRVEDVVAELRPRLELLEHQASRARQHQGIVAEIETAQVRWLAHRLDELQRAQRSAEQAERQTEHEAQAEKARETALATEVATLEARLAEGRQALDERRLSLARLREDAARWRQQAETANELASAYRRQRTDLDAELAELEAAQAKLAETIRQREAERQQADDELARVAALVRATEAKLEEHHRQHQSVRAALGQGRKALTELETACLELRQGVELWRGRHERAQERLAQHSLSAEECRRLHEAAQATLADREAALAGSTQTEQQRREQARQFSSQVEAQEQAEREALAEVGRLERELSRLRARLEVLQHSQEALTGYYTGVRAVLAATGARGGGRLSGIVGPVSGLLRAPADMELAVEVALGGHVQDIVVERWEHAEAAIGLLKSSQAGRATFLPLDTIRWSSGRPPSDGPGVLGLASRLVECEPRLQSVAEHLLGRTLVVVDLEVARRVLPQCGPGWQIVTLGGEIVRSSGAVTGGSPGTQVGFLSRSRELRDLPQQIANLQRQTDDARRQALAASRERQRSAESAALAQRQVLEAEMGRRRAADLLGASRRELTGQAAQMKSLALSQQSLRSETEKAEQECRRTQARWQEAEAQRQTLAQAQVLEGASLARLEEQERGLAAALARERTELALLEQQVRNQEEQRQGLRQSLASVESSRQSRQERAQALGASEGERAQQAATAKREVDALAMAIAGSEGELVPLQLDLERLAGDLQSSHRQRELQLQRLAEAEVARRGAAVESQRVLGMAEALQQEIERDLGPVLDTASEAGWLVDRADGTLLLRPQPAGDARRLRLDLERHRQRLRALGAVNQEAVAEYAAAQERYTFLTSQVQDLHQAADGLHRVIMELQTTARLLLQQSFTAVAAEFRYCFSALFQGGSAHLTLTNPDDLSQTGIEIVAQPPGKRSQSLALLSGGERALTGVALLFAILRAHPVPFCFLDEVDAALDEANVARFCSLLSQLSQRTQFVLVTHNRLTMEAAGAIYGVSLSESSVSRLVSLRLDDHRPGGSSSFPSAERLS